MTVTVALVVLLAAGAYYALRHESRPLPPIVVTLTLDATEFIAAMRRAGEALARFGESARRATQALRALQAASDPGVDDARGRC